jgi:hypothetical protein
MRQAGPYTKPTATHLHLHSDRNILGQIRLLPCNPSSPSTHCHGFHTIACLSLMRLSTPRWNITTRTMSRIPSPICNLPRDVPSSRILSTEIKSLSARTDFLSHVFNQPPPGFLHVDPLLLSSVCTPALYLYVRNPATSPLELQGPRRTRDIIYPRPNRVTSNPQSPRRSCAVIGSSVF